MPRAETQYPHRSDKHQLSEDNALAFHASGYREKKSALGKTSASSTVVNETRQAIDLFIGIGSVISHFCLLYLRSKTEEQSLKVAK